MFLFLTDNLQRSSSTPRLISSRDIHQQQRDQQRLSNQQNRGGVVATIQG